MINQEQRDLWGIIWNIALAYPAEKIVGYYHVHLFSESIHTFSITITALSKDSNRWLSFSKALCDVDIESHPYRGVMRDLFALPVNEKPPAPRLRAGQLLWFLKQFSLLRMIPDAQEVGFSDGAIKSAIQFHASVEKLQSMADHTEEELDRLKDGLLNMASSED